MIKLITLVVCLAAGAFSQTFEVASVKKNTSGERPTGDAKGGTLRMYNMPMKPIIARAYGVSNDKVVGPAWLDTDGYDIVAKIPADVSETTLFTMLRNLLVERFKLEVHHDDAPTAVYALVVAKGGPKLPLAAAGGQTRDTCRRGQMQLTCKNEKMTMAGLTQNFPRWMSMNWFDLPIVDQTGLDGEYDFTLTWTMTNRSEQPVEPPAVSFFDALQDQLGLKLEQRKAPVDKVIVDHIERSPIEN